MTTPTHGPIERAWVQRLRAMPSVADLKGGVHEGFAPEKAPYPFAVWNLVFAPYDWDWTNSTLIAGIDCSVFSRDPEEAKGLDAAIAAWMSNQPLTVEGQHTLLCRRQATLPTPPDVDDDNKKVYQAGGTYEIWTTPDEVVLSGRVFEVGASDSAPASDAV